MENLSGEWTRLLYCTTGVLLRKLQHDRHLSSLTHVIVDEVGGPSRPPSLGKDESFPSPQVHERSVQSDFLLTILKDVVMRRSDLRLVLMSATVDCHKFSTYFNRCPVIAIPGRAFPVEVGGAFWGGVEGVGETVPEAHRSAVGSGSQVSHLEDIVEQTGYVLEKDSEYSQKILEEEEEISVSVTQKGGRTFQHQVPSPEPAGRRATGSDRGEPTFCLRV